MPRPRNSTPSNARGFTLLEMLAAISIAALVLALAVPASAKIYDSIRYREAVRNVVSLLSSARYAAVKSGKAQDVEVNPETMEVRLGDKVHVLPENFRLSVRSAQELNSLTSGIIRFYPEGGTSGGGIEIESGNGRGVRIAVDWLVGRVTQEAYEVGAT